MKRSEEGRASPSPCVATVINSCFHLFQPPLNLSSVSQAVFSAFNWVDHAATGNAGPRDGREAAPATHEAILQAQNVASWYREFAATLCSDKGTAPVHRLGADSWNWKRPASAGLLPEAFGQGGGAGVQVCTCKRWALLHHPSPGTNVFIRAQETHLLVLMIPICCYTPCSQEPVELTSLWRSDQRLVLAFARSMG
jgi:hypothetical protein